MQYILKPLDKNRLRPSTLSVVGGPFQGAVRDGNVAGTQRASPSQRSQIVIFQGVSSRDRHRLVRADLLDHPHVTRVRCVDDLDRPQPWRRTSSYECPPFARGASFGVSRDFRRIPDSQRRILQAFGDRRSTDSSRGTPRTWCPRAPRGVPDRKENVSKLRQISSLLLKQRREFVIAADWTHGA